MRLKRYWTYSTLVHLLLVLLTTSLLVMGHQNRQWHEALATAFPQTLAPAPGKPFAQLAITTPDHRPTTWRFASNDKPTVLFLFSADCSSCNAQVDAWLNLYHQFGDQFRFLGVGLDPATKVAEFAERSALPFPAVVPKDLRLFEQLNGIHAVPQTLLIDRTGTVIRHFAGRVTSDFLAMSAPESAD